MGILYFVYCRKTSQSKLAVAMSASPCHSASMTPCSETSMASDGSDYRRPMNPDMTMEHFDSSRASSACSESSPTPDGAAIGSTIDDKKRKDPNKEAQ